MLLRSSPLAFITALAALLALVAIPRGMMPVWGADGFSIQLCSLGHGETAEIGSDDPDFETLRLVEAAKKIANGQPANPNSDDNANSDCEFASYSSKFALQGSDIPPSITGGDNRNYSSPKLALPISHRLHLPPSTGPPVSL